MNGGVPACFMHDQMQVVFGPQVFDLVELPAHLGRLALERAHRHRVEFGPHQIREVAVEPGPATPGAAANVGLPRRISLPSAMSSCTRNALCSISIATARPSSSFGSAPNARPADRHSAGRNAFPGREGYSRIGA